ncbi:MAG: tyrosine-type recombinase/integrase [Lachnospiraceae bacterium]|nr:tyrosine-type recombinase/integrase [Lachnospiraceae bacterium]
MAKIYNISGAVSNKENEDLLLSKLYEFLPQKSGIINKIRNNLYFAMTNSFCYSLSETGLNTLVSIKEYLESNGYLGSLLSQHIFYLEDVLLSEYIYENNQIVKEILTYHKMDKYYKRTAVFLVMAGVSSLKGIDYDIRNTYLYYLRNVYGVYEKNISAYKNALDFIKHKSIEANCVSFNKPVLRYEDSKIFLLYHPDIDIAKSFSFTQDKQELLFDFSLNAPKVLKRQIFDMLNYVLTNKPYQTINERKDRRDRFISPLNYLYKFCIENDIEDIFQMTKEDDLAFINKMDALGKTLAKRNKQILDNTKKFLFMQSERINWEANVWYMDKLTIDESRNNPAEPVIRLKFDYIKDEENRTLAKLYAKYLVGITDFAINNIRQMLYDIARLLEHCDEFMLSVKELTEIDMDAFFQIIDYGIKNEAYNNKVINIHKFFSYLLSKEKIDKIPFKPEFYTKKVHPYHRERALGDEIIKEMLLKINYFPEHLRLMYFNLLGTGLRINEICMLKGDAYFEEKNDTWIKVYQNKMYADKVIPIPKALYELMKDFIDKNGIGKDEYIFKNEKGGAYNVGTFRKRMIICCAEYGIRTNNYIFRPHDYRHTIASNLFDSGATLQSIREYLGHKTEEMSKQYIDFVPNKIDKANEDYFNDKENIIKADISRTVSMKIYLKDLPNYDSEADKERKSKYGNRAYNLYKIKSETLRTEVKDFIMYRATIVSTKTMVEDLTSFNMLCKFFLDESIDSVKNIDFETIYDLLKKWLLKNGYSIIIKMKRNSYGEEYNREHFSISYLRKIYEFINDSEDINEYEKDKWELTKLGITLKMNETRPVNTIDFTGIRQNKMREETKRIAFMELGYKAVSSVVQDVASVRFMSEFLYKEYPLVNSLTDINRDIVEEYLIYMNTESGRGGHQPKDVALLREIMNIAGRMFECNKLKTVFLSSDVQKKKKAIYRAYSDDELKRINEAIITMDKQMARALILHQLLGTRISDLLYLKQDCISKIDGKYVINIYQTKTGKTYRKPVTEDIKNIIDASIRFTCENYGASSYVFADSKNPEKPMSANKVSYHLRKMIYENDLRDDKGEMFTASTHIFRRNFGKKLVELNIDDEKIAKLLGHSGTSSVNNYRKLSNENLAKQTKKVRDDIDKMIRMTYKEGV